jgi:hypothetical protein
MYMHLAAKQKIIKILFIGILLLWALAVFTCGPQTSGADARSADTRTTAGDDEMDETLTTVNEPRWITADVGLRLRSGPGADFDTLVVIPYAEEVKLLQSKSEVLTIDGVQGEWGKVQWKNSEGWVFTGYLSKEEITKLPEFTERFVWKGSRRNDAHYFSIFYPKEGWEVLLDTDHTMLLRRDRTEIQIPTIGVGLGDCSEKVTEITIGKRGDFKVKKHRILTPSGHFIMIFYDNYPEDFGICMQNPEADFSAGDIAVFERIASTVEVITKEQAEEFWAGLEGGE